MKITKQTMNSFLLASFMATSPIVTIARELRGPRGAFLSESNTPPVLRASRFLQDTTDEDNEADATIDTESGRETSEMEGNETVTEVETAASIATPVLERECEMEFKKQDAVFECTAKTSTDDTEIRDKIQFKVKATQDDALKITIEYETETEMENLETETETQYTVVFDRLLEYRKAEPSQTISRSGNLELELHAEEFKWDEDEIVAEWPIVEFSELAPLQMEGGVNKFSVSSLSDLATFTFTIHESSDDNMDVTANSMKIDFLLENYPWAESGDTFVALICHIETERDVEIESDGGLEQVMDVVISFADAIDTVGFVPFGQYTWADYAEVDVVGVEDTVGDTDSTNAVEDNSTRRLDDVVKTIPVVATVAPRNTTFEADPMFNTTSTTFNDIAFSFVGAARGASRIYWDPTAGVGYMGETTDDDTAAGKDDLVGAGTVDATTSSAVMAKTTFASFVVATGVYVLMTV